LENTEEQIPYQLPHRKGQNQQAFHLNPLAQETPEIELEKQPLTFRQKFGDRLLGIWKMIPLAIWWSTWKERNQRIFAGKVRSYQVLKLYFLRTLYSWSLILGDGTNLKLLNFVDKIRIESMRA